MQNSKERNWESLYQANEIFWDHGEASPGLVDFLASTTTIPAQIVKKFKCKVVPIYIERVDEIHFKMTVNKPISYSDEMTIEEITENLNKLLEKMILANPSQWIWTHDRWK